MSNDRQLNYVNNLQNRDQKLYYVDDANELNSINLKENDKIYAINDNKLFQMEIVDQEEELSGSIVSFNGRNNTKIKSLVANIEPRQDLHGYDYPWPAGGGKNLCPNTGWTQGQIQTGGIQDESPVAISSDFIFLASGTYILSRNYDYSGSTGLGQMAFHSYDGQKNYLSDSSWVDNNAIITVENDTYIRITTRITSSGPQITPSIIDNGLFVQLSTGSIPKSWTPYSNECPISGHTGAEVTRTGKNITSLIKPGLLPRFLWGTGWNALRDFLNQLLPGTYTMSFKYKILTLPTNSSSVAYGPITLNAGSETLIPYIITTDTAPFVGKEYSTKRTFTITESTAGKVSEVYCYIDSATHTDNGDTSIRGTYDMVDFMIEMGSGSDYEPYTGNQISVTFPETIYGGEDEVISGKLISNMRFIENLGDLEWYMAGSATDRRFYAYISGLGRSAQLGKCLCSIYPYRDSNPGIIVGQVGWYDQCLLIHDNAYSSVEDFKASLDGATAVYELETPTEYQLTPQEVKTLLGVNNIWANTGNITVKIAEKGVTAFELEPYI